MFAVIATGGKQYRVTTGQKLRIERLDAEVGAAVTFDKVLLTADGETAKIGTPTVAGAAVAAKVIVNDRADKVIVFKYHSKVRRRKKNGHRQPYTEVEITSIK
jgi:large subunit ribosomal protein L21